MLKVDMKKFSAIACHDPEFVREMRYFDGRIKLVIGDDVSVINFSNGKLLGADVNVPLNTKAEIFIQGDINIWQNLLAEIPRPFYQCIQTAQVRHGMQVSDSTVTLAYLPALNRMIAIIRAMVNGGVA